MSASVKTQTHLSPHLKALEDESIHILREVAGQCDNVALLFSGGKDSVVVYELARRAFAPAAVPFELLHIDTGHNFPEVIDFRDQLVARTGARLRVAHVQDWIDRGDLRERPDHTRNPLQTVPLVETIAEQKYDAVLGGARRDEERARAKERIFSVRDSFGGWQYIKARRIELPPIYYAHQREVFYRDGMWLTPGPWGSGPVETKWVRYRTVGDMSCTGAIESTATTIDQVIAEITTTTLTERGATRADDRLSESAMEDRKKEGYF